MRMRFFLLFLFFITACAQESLSIKPEDLPKRGRSIYLAQCISCPAPAPARDGPMGPAVKGASRKLLEARLLQRAYPAGYTPKRTTHVMPAMPHLQGELDALAAFLS